MAIAIRAEHLSKEYRLGVINHGMLYKDMQSWIARRLGKPDPHESIGKERFEGSEDRYWALKDLCFDIEQGDRVGVIGRNGAGKSTLLKIISRITAPTEGSVKLRGKVVSLLEVGTGFHPELTGRENVFLNGAILGMKKWQVQRKLDEIIHFSELEQFIDTPVKRYSSGMYVRLAFAVAAHLDSEILLADEVLAVGDAAFQKKCLGKMAEVSNSQGRTILFVSHQMNFISQLCDKCILLNKGRVGDIGKTADVVRTYLEGQEYGGIQYARDAAEPEAEIDIHYLALVDESGRPVNSIEMRKNYSIEIEYAVNKKVAGAFVAFHIHSRDKVLLIDSCDIDGEPGLLADRPQGTYRFRIGLPPQLLNAGHYSFEGWAGIPQHDVTMSKTPAIGFEVVDTGSGISIHNQTRACLIGLPMDWKRR
jgi:lipopolysaccharide transport system ATP-binding protein